MINKKTALALVISIAIFSSAVTFSISGMLYGGSFRTNEATKLLELKHFIEQNYVNGTEDMDLMTGAYKGMFSAIGDPYSAYYTKVELETLKESVEGTFVGVGVELDQNELGEVIIVAPMKGLPADIAGVKTGDIIIKVDDIDAKGLTSAEVVTHIRGEDGTKVKLFVKRMGVTELIEFDLIRQKISQITVRGEILENDIAYVRIDTFDEDTSTEFKNVMSEIEGAKRKGLIIDLRQNPGGFVTEAVNIADELMEDKLIVYTENKNKERIDHKATRGALNIPLVLLVDEGSASASEILAGAVQDNKVGTLIGTQTFGKGLVQGIKTFPKDGTGLKLTIQKYYTPNGVSINKIGITPDIEIKITELDKTDIQLEKALEFLN